MADAITVKALQDASLDAKSLEEVVNGNDTKQVTTRLGENYPSVKKAIKTLFENGGLPAKPFATKVLMTASALVDGDYAMVTDDTVNNGLYVKTAGAWVKSDYDPLAQAKTYVDIATEATVNLIEEKTAPLITSAGKALHQWVDADLNIVGEIDANAGLRLVGIEGTVQEALKSGEGSGGQLTSNVLNLTHAFIDDEDAVVAGFDTNGGLRATGMTVSVQEYLDIRKEPTPTRNYTSKDLFTDASNKYFLNMSVSNVKNAPVPFGLLPQRYTMPDTIVNELSLPTPTEFIPIDTPYGKNDKVVHPYVIEFKNLFRGYHYLMCITPYRQESNENPTVMGSNDLTKWDLLTGFTQPLSTPSPTTYHSDNGFCYDPINGMLVCYFRESPIGGGFDSTIFYRATRDGIEWTDRVVMLSPESDSMHTSPCVLFNPNDGLWHMWIGEKEGTFRHYTAKHLNNEWTLKTTTNMRAWWHAEVKWLGDKYIMLVNRRAGNLFFAISDDGDNWIEGAELFTTNQDAVYKASFLPKFNATGQVAFDIFYTTDHAVNPLFHRRFFHLTTNLSNSTITEI